MRLIDVDALIEKIHIHQKITKEQAVGEIQDDEVRLYLALHIAEEFVKMLPTIEVEQKKGRWIDYIGSDLGVEGQWMRDDGKTVFLQCNQCHALYVRNLMLHANFCPNCGARMEVKDE